MERWKGHFKKLLSGRKAAVLKYGGNKSIETKKIERIREEELIKALRKMKLGKASEKDEITAEIIKFLSQEEINELLTILNAAVTYKEIPSDWKTDIILPIFNSGDKRESRNYKGFTLLRKILARIMERRLREI